MRDRFHPDLNSGLVFRQKPRALRRLCRRHAPSASLRRGTGRCLPPQASRARLRRHHTFALGVATGRTGSRPGSAGRRLGELRLRLTPSTLHRPAFHLPRHPAEEIFPPAGRVEDLLEGEPPPRPASAGGELTHWHFAPRAHHPAEIYCHVRLHTFTCTSARVRCSACSTRPRSNRRGNAGPFPVHNLR